MKNSIIQDNRLAQTVKIILFSSSFFIFWSALALISSIYHPLSKSGLVLPANGTSSTLADSLYQEIIQSYFSLFTIFVLVIFLMAGFIGYLLSRRVADELFPFHESQSPLNVLLSRIFNSIPRKIMDFSNAGVINEFNESLSQIYGPVKILIPNGTAILISIGMRDFRLVISDGISPIQIFSQERIANALSFSSNEYFVNLKNPDPNDSFNSVKLRYRFDFQNLAKNADLFGMQLFSSNNLNYWKELLDSIIQLEFDSLVKAEGEPALEISSADRKDLNSDGGKAGSHPIPHAIHFLNKPLVKPKITRNRKRGIYPLAALNPEIMDEMESMRAAKEKLSPLMNRFLEDLSRTVIELFGFNPIIIIGYEIGEEK